MRQVKAKLIGKLAGAVIRSTGQGNYKYLKRQLKKALIHRNMDSIRMMMLKLKPEEAK